MMNSTHDVWDAHGEYLQRDLTPPHSSSPRAGSSAYGRRCCRPPRCCVRGTYSSYSGPRRACCCRGLASLYARSAPSCCHVAEATGPAESTHLASPIPRAQATMDLALGCMHEVAPRLMEAANMGSALAAARDALQARYSRDAAELRSRSPDARLAQAVGDGSELVLVALRRRPLSREQLASRRLEGRREVEREAQRQQAATSVSVLFVFHHSSLLCSGGAGAASRAAA